MSNSRGRTLLIVIILLSAVLLAAGNILCHALVVQELTGTSPPAEPGLLLQQVDPLDRPVGRPDTRSSSGSSAAPRCWSASSWPCWSACSAAAADDRGRGERAAAATAPPTARCACSRCCSRKGAWSTSSKRTSQPYTDAQVGAAVRAIHAGCRKALHERMRDRAHLRRRRTARRSRSRSASIPPRCASPATCTASRRSAACCSTAAGGPRSVAAARRAGVDAAILAPAGGRRSR